MQRALAPFAAVVSAAALAGCASDAAMQAADTSSTTAHYVCTDGAAFDIRFTRQTEQVMTFSRTVPTARDSAVLMLNGAAANLAAQPVGSGMHYAGDGYDFRGKGEEATLTTPDGTTRTCRTGS